MDLRRLQEVLDKEPGYRLRQVKKALFQDLIDDWSKATNLPLRLRNELKEKCEIGISGDTSVSGDGNTVKVLISLKDGLKIESVLMRYKKRYISNTVCVSCQVGCALGCSFCATGTMGFMRDMDSIEICEQVIFFGRYLKKSGQKVTNVVFMGMGEPLLNYENVIGAIKTLNDKEGFNLGMRRFSISTVGIIDGIVRLAGEEPQVNLAVSLNAPNDILRAKMMPINRKYPINRILKAVDNYIEKTRRKVMFEYVMIKGLNDSDESARELAGLTRGRLCFVNLIPYNPTGMFERPSYSRIKAFKEALEKAGVTVTQRYHFGGQIKAGCGQLAAESVRREH